MILDSAPSWQGDDWQVALKNLVTDEAGLARQWGHPLAPSATRQRASDTFPLRIPSDYLQRIPTTDPDHPLLRQFIPSADEMLAAAGFGTDPVGETGKTPRPGILHKYRGRVLLIVSSHCPVHCRYCFRRHFPYDDNRNNREDWLTAIDYIRRDSSIREVIYSGGDPLSAPDNVLHWLTATLATIPHLTRLRVHTRFPVVIPSRITLGLVRWLTGTRLLPTMVLHCNHPDELDTTVAASLRTLREAGVTLLNQSVLLKGVNDHAATLAALSEKLFASGVLPYYLHLLDKVEGAAHFAIPDAEAFAIYRELQAELPGYLLPKLVREKSGESSKTLLIG
jgi:EF-P beta-lysylation protein EpmB